MEVGLKVNYGAGHGKQAALQVQADDTLARIRDRVGLLLGTHPDSLYVYVRTQERHFKEPQWNRLFFQLAKDGEISVASLLTWVGNTTPPVTLDTTSLPELTLSVWENREVPVLEELYDRAYAEYVPLGFLPEENVSLYPFPVREPCGGGSVTTITPAFHWSTVWMDAGYEPELWVVRVDEVASSLTAQCRALYFPFAGPSGAADTFPSALRTQILQEDAALKRSLDLLGRPLSSKEITAQGFTRLRFKQMYNPSDRSLSLEQMFYALTVSEEIPLLSFCRSSDEAATHKMFSISKRVTVPPDEYARWMRVKFPKNEPMLLLYHTTAPEGKPIGGAARIPLVRLGVTEDHLHWTVDAVASNLTFFEETVKPYMKALIRHVGQIIEGLKLDFEKAEWVSSSYRLAVKRETVGARISASRQAGLLKCMEGLGIPLTRSGEEAPSFFLYKRVSDFGMRRPEDLMILALVHEGKQPDDILQAYREKYGLADAGESEAVLGRILDIQADNFKAFGKSAVWNLLGLHEIEVQNVLSRPNFQQILERASALFRLFYAKLMTDEEEERIKAACPRPTRVVASRGAASEPDTMNTDDFLNALENLLDGPPSADAMSDLGPPQPQAEEHEEGVDEGSDSDSDDEMANVGSVHNALNQRLKARDPERFLYKVSKADSKRRYASACGKPNQPVIYTQAEWDALQADATTAPYVDRYDKDPKKIMLDPAKGNIYVCPDYFCITDELPLLESDLAVRDGKKVCPKCGGEVIPPKSKGLDLGKYSLLPRSDAKFPQFVKKVNPVNGLPLPCCMKREPKEDPSTAAAPRAAKGANPNQMEYVLGGDRFPLEEGRFGSLPLHIEEWLGVTSASAFQSPSSRLLKNGGVALLRVGVQEPVVFSTLSKVLKAELRDLDDSDADLRFFMSLNNGNLVRLYAAEWDSDAELQESFKTWAEANGYGPEDVRMFRVWSALHRFKAAAPAADTPLSHVWDFVERSAGLHIVVINMDEPGRVKLRCPPYGAKDFSGSSESDLMMFVERGCKFEPLALVEKKGIELVPHFRISHSMLQRYGMPIVFPPNLFQFCMETPKVTEYVRPKRLQELPEALVEQSRVRAFLLNPYTKVTALQDTCGNLLPVYPSGLPDSEQSQRIPLRYGYEASELPSAASQLAFLQSLASEPATAYLKPSHWVVQNTTTPNLVVGLQVAGRLRVPIKPEPLGTSGLHATGLPHVFVSSLDPNIDQQITSPLSKNVASAVERLTREDLIRDWILYDFMRFVQTDATIYYQLLKATDAPTPALTERITEWVAANVAERPDDPLQEIPKFKKSCSLEKLKVCSGACVVDGGVCKTTTAGSDLTLKQVVGWILYACFQDTKKRELILSGLYPRVTSILYKELGHEVLFSDIDIDLDAGMYPSYGTKTCGKRLLFDNAGDPRGEVTAPPPLAQGASGERRSPASTPTTGTPDDKEQ